LAYAIVSNVCLALYRPLFEMTRLMTVVIALKLVYKASLLVN